MSDKPMTNEAWCGRERRALLAIITLLVGCSRAEDDGLTTTNALTSPSEEALRQDVEQARISIKQTSELTIARGAPDTARVVAYGDSIFAGYRRSVFNVARRAAPYVAGEYLGARWNANIEVIRRTESGAVASQVYDRVVQDSSFMQSAETRVVFVEMCGNDYLKARRAYERASGTCDDSALDEAIDTCVTNMERSMIKINATAPIGAAKVIANLYYPGFDGDDVVSRCRDAATGETVNVQDKLLPLMAHSNWRACTLARRYGFQCVDAFAELMGADYDTDGDGQADVEGLRFKASESEDDYVTRISVHKRATVRDAKAHLLGGGSSVGYLQGDDIHPTYFQDTVNNGAVRSFSPDFSDAELRSGKTPQWNRFGHERLGWALARAVP